MRLIVDRIEEEYAICEELERNKIVQIPLSSFSFEVKENNYISIGDKGVYVFDDEETKMRNNNIRENFEKLMKKGT